LSIVGYFRLANYWRPMEVDKVKHLFKPNSTFDNALSLYYFDKELCALIFAAIQSIEIALRTKIMYHFSLAHGPFWFMNDGLISIYKKDSQI
jgi:abortive infection bacteriophage resistance protein